MVAGASASERSDTEDRVRKNHNVNTVNAVMESISKGRREFGVVDPDAWCKAGSGRADFIVQVCSQFHGAA